MWRLAVHQQYMSTGREMGPFARYYANVFIRRHSLNNVLGFASTIIEENVQLLSIFAYSSFHWLGKNQIMCRWDYIFLRGIKIKYKTQWKEVFRLKAVSKTEAKLDSKDNAKFIVNAFTFPSEKQCPPPTPSTM